MNPHVNLVVEPAVRRRVTPPTAGVVVRALRRLLRRGAGAATSVELLLTDDAGIAALHRIHFGDAKPTDVLSFPAGEPMPGMPDDDLGQIVINVDAVGRQAATPGAAGWRREAVSLCIHAVAHLLGHDHGERVQARRMLACERKLAGAVGRRDVRRPYGGGGR